jgi:hypothetical protein
VPEDHYYINLRDEKQENHGLPPLQRRQRFGARVRMPPLKRFILKNKTLLRY